VDTSLTSTFSGAMTTTAFIVFGIIIYLLS
jgi:hypothetical protein